MALSQDNKLWAIGDKAICKKTLAVALKLQRITGKWSVIILISFIGFYVMQIANWKSGLPRIIGKLL